MNNTNKIIRRRYNVGSQQMLEPDNMSKIEQEANEFRILFPVSYKEAIQNFIDKHFGSLSREEKSKLVGDLLIKIAMLSQFALGATLMDMVIRSFGIKNSVPKAGETIEIVLRAAADTAGGYASYIGKHRVVWYYSKITFEKMAHFTDWLAYNFDVRQWNHVNWLTFLICLPVVPTTAFIFGYLTPLSFVEMAHILKIGFDNKIVDGLISAVSNIAVQTIPQVISTGTNLLGLGYAVKGTVQHVNDTIYFLLENPAYRKKCEELQNQLEAGRLRWKHAIEEAINFDQFDRAEVFLKDLLNINDDSFSLAKLSGAEIKKLRDERATLIKECKALRKANKKLEKKIAKEQHLVDSEINLQGEIQINNDSLLQKYNRLKAIETDLDNRAKYVKDITDQLDTLRKNGELAKKLLQMSKDFATQSIPKPRSKSEDFFRFLALAPTFAAVYGLNNFAEITRMACIQYNMGAIADEAAWFDMIGMSTLAMGVLTPLQQAVSYYLFGRGPNVRILEPTEEAKVYAKAHGWSIIGTFPNVCQSIIIKQPPAQWVFAFISSYLIELFAMLAIERENAESAAKEGNFLKALGASVNAVLAETCNVVNLTPADVHRLYEYCQELNRRAENTEEMQPKAASEKTERYWPVTVVQKVAQYLPRLSFLGSSSSGSNSTTPSTNNTDNSETTLLLPNDGRDNSRTSSYNTMV